MGETCLLKSFHDDVILLRIEEYIKKFYFLILAFHFNVSFLPVFSKRFFFKVLVPHFPHPLAWAINSWKSLLPFRASAYLCNLFPQKSFLLHIKNVFLALAPVGPCALIILLFVKFWVLWWMVQWDHYIFWQAFILDFLHVWLRLSLWRRDMLHMAAILNM